MTKRLKIMIGPNRQEMQIAHVNDSSQPTLINSEYFVGRVLIKIRDFEGITPDGSPPIRNHVYFDGRSRKFDIQIEGRFKKREGVEQYSGEEIHFGSDFDHIVDFPKSAFNAGMRVARWIDPNVFYDLTPPSERPFIMSPYLACMNTLCAWPSPDRLGDALVCLRHGDREDDHHHHHYHHHHHQKNNNSIDTSQADDMVPMEQVDDPAEVGAGKKKIARHPRRYWRFIGLKSDHGRIDAFIAKNHHLLAQQQPAHEEEPQPHEQESDNLINGQTSTDDNEDEEFDDADAFSCRAPSSHATYSTAIEDYGIDSKPSLNSAGSYRFTSPRRIFPRHQISLGAGMRDLFQDAEMEAKEREGEAEAQRMVEMMGEDDSMPPPQPTTTITTGSSSEHYSPSPNHGQENHLHEEAALKRSGSKVKHSLKKLKIAFKKITPSLSSASTGTISTTTSSSTPDRTPSKRKSYSTVFNSKQPTRGDNLAASPMSSILPNGTVARAASRTLPRDSSLLTLRNDSRSAETVKNLARSSSLMSRPQSHHPSSSSHLSQAMDQLAQQQHQMKIRSTSMDQARSPDFRGAPTAIMGSLKMQSMESSLSTIHQSSTATGEQPPQEGGCSRLSALTESDAGDSTTRFSSPSTCHSRSHRTSATSKSPPRRDNDNDDDEEEALEKCTPSRIAQVPEDDGTVAPTRDSVVVTTPTTPPDSHDDDDRIVSSNQAPTAGSPTATSSDDAQRSPPPGPAVQPSVCSSSHTSTPQAASRPSLVLRSSEDPTVASDQSSNTTTAVVTHNNLDHTHASSAAMSSRSRSQTQTQQTQIQQSINATSPSQAQIDEAPELEDVEVGDLLFANMLNIAGDPAVHHPNQDPVQMQLGPWRFKNPTTDILEDNTFVFLNKSVDVQKRRKHFSEGGGKHRKAFTYDPDVVYATSFFSPFMDFNTFDLSIGPVKINVAKVFGDMPVRYTLRSTRIDARNSTEEEEEIFVTISFELVDV